MVANMMGSMVLKCNEIRATAFSRLYRLLGDKRTSTADVSCRNSSVEWLDAIYA